jgi:hypothetical protein
MKKIIFIGLIFSTLFSQAASIDAWRGILQTPELVEYFDNVFQRLGIEVEETGERFTIEHTGSELVLSDGIDNNNVDFIVPIKLQNIENMINHSKDGKIDSSESWRILDVLFTPLTEVTLQTPVLAVNWRRKLAGVEDLIHVYLINPEGGEASKHTLIYIKGEWLVLRGLHGTPKRTYRMSPEHSLEYQRVVFKAIKKDTFFGWMRFAKWYKKWRKDVSITH